MINAGSCCRLRPASAEQAAGELFCVKFPYWSNIKNKLLREILSWVLHICAALFIGLFLTNFVIQRTIVYSFSMEPTLYEGDSLWVEKISPKLGAIDKGDIVTIYAPEVLNDRKQSLIKRVIAVGGDTVEIANGKVCVNGKEAVEEYINGGYTGTEDSQYSSLTVPKGYIYVLGDNRSIRIVDSRTMGPIDVKRVTGKAVMRMYPLNRFGILH
jgi:signal peptidase I